jgi:hypothetical protein
MVALRAVGSRLYEPEAALYHLNGGWECRPPCRFLAGSHPVHRGPLDLKLDRDQ